MFNERLILTLLNIKGLGRKTVNKILQWKIPDSLREEDLLEFLNKSKNYIKRMPKIDLEDIKLSKKKSDYIIEKCKEKDIKIITILDNNLPEKLKEIEDNPVLLYYKGNIDLINKKSIAIIGTRRPTSHGEKIAYKLGEVLSQRDFIIVSGLALGCDTCAHLSCVNNYQKTIAVLPSPIDNIYPTTNIKLAEEIIKNNGCIISEYPPEEKILKGYFVERDRLESALSEGIIVVETGIKGGTIHTVNYGFNQGKVVACYKHGEKYKDVAKGNRELLKDNRVYSIHDKKSLENFLEKLK